MQTYIDLIVRSLMDRVALSSLIIELRFIVLYQYCVSGTDFKIRFRTNIRQRKRAVGEHNVELVANHFVSLRMHSWPTVFVKET